MTLTPLRLDLDLDLAPGLSMLAIYSHMLFVSYNVFLPLWLAYVVQVGALSADAYRNPVVSKAADAAGWELRLTEVLNSVKELAVQDRISQVVASPGSKPCPSL